MKTPKPEPESYDSKVIFMLSRCCLTFCLAACGAMLFGCLLRAEDQTKQTEDRARVVYVAVERAQVHSGPSEDTYPTSIIERGTMLEVFHRTKDNWLGIRPPEGSFSWVAATDAYLLPGGRIIEITSDSGVSWIGTELGSAKQYRWQVQLNRGEQLAVLGENSVRDADGREMLWYKIAAPSGEFRWIQQQLVSAQPVAAAKPAEAVPTVDASSPDREPTTKAAASKPAALAASSARAGGPAAETSGSAKTKQGESTPADPNGKVMSASYQSEFEDDVFGATPEEIYYGDEVMAEEYVEGEWFDGPPMQAGRQDRFAGWHAWELDDDGLRLTLFDKLFGHRRQQPVHDPLNADPFDLSMPATASGPKHFPQPAPSGPVITEMRQPRGYRPWRDPYTLREQRESGVTPNLAPGVSRFDPSNGLRDDTFARSNTGDAGGLPGDPSAAPARLTSTPLEQLAGRIEARLASLSSTTPAASSDDAKWYGVTTRREVGAPTTQETALKANPNVLAAGIATQELSQLQVMLGEVVAGPMQTWSLQALYDQARDLIDRGATAIERGQARLLVERIEEFANLAKKHGYMALNPTTLATGTPVVTASGVSVGNSYNTVHGLSVASGADRLPNYDATGWLVPVLAASPGQPTHAITDDSGQILAYVSGLPGMNLDRYLNQAVGITGLRGFLPQLQTGHIQAQRIVRLQ